MNPRATTRFSPPVNKSGAGVFLPGPRVIFVDELDCPELKALLLRMGCRYCEYEHVEGLDVAGMAGFENEQWRLL